MMPNGYETHFPILAACIARDRGPILEMGCGVGSTPLCHYAAAGGRRSVLTAESDEAWLKKFSAYRAPWHEFEYVPPIGGDDFRAKMAGWRAWQGLYRFPYWGTVLVDCAPGEIRHELAALLADRARYVICHDSETDYGSGGNYQYEKAKKYFRYVTEFQRFRPYTLILSNCDEFKIEDVDKAWVPPGGYDAV